VADRIISYYYLRLFGFVTYRVTLAARALNLNTHLLKLSPPIQVTV
jgi:hypothetical protein